MWHLSICIFFFFTLFAVSCGDGTNKTACVEKEKSLALLDTVEDLLSKAKRFYPSCAENVTATNDSECGAKEKSLAYLEVMQKLISEVKEHYPTCKQPDNRPMDCSDIQANGQNTSGIYTIWPISRATTGKGVKVYCDMETDGGGWTVIQRRGNFTPQQDFYQDWEAYKKGFGNITRDFWLGNDNIHALSSQKENEIRFELQDVEGEKRFAVYKVFWIDDETSNYTLHISKYIKGDAGDCMTMYSGLRFSTKDKGVVTCAEATNSGWWYSICSGCNLNGLYQPGVKSDKKSFNWYEWHKFDALASVEIKLRMN